MLKHKKIANLILIVLAAAVAGGGVWVGQARADDIQTVAQSYNAAQSLQKGMIVQLDEKDKSTVVPATYNDSKKTFGVTVAASETPVSLSSGAATQQAYVVTSGRYDVLVSNQNGSITIGDFVGISAIDGIGMKADATENTVLGRAVGSFDGKTGVISSTSLKLGDGKQMQAAIGSVLVDVAIRSNPSHTGGQGGLPSFIQSGAASLAGKSVGTTQVYAALLVLLLGISVSGALIYSGVQSSMQAIGRNPLAKQSIMRNLLQVIIAGLMIFIGCLIAVYLILKL